MAIQCNVANHENVRAIFEKAANAFGTIDIVIHAAGVLGPVSNIGDAPVEEWWSAFVSYDFMIHS
jgi:NAD(P)-dependent dehydrogenase (short-subunit alcohol dehydrogenase family)